MRVNKLELAKWRPVFIKPMKRDEIDKNGSHNLKKIMIQQKAD
jgi:hypothetical protein